MRNAELITLLNGWPSLAAPRFAFAATSESSVKVVLMQASLCFINGKSTRRLPEGGNRGMPIIVSTPNHAAGKVFIQVAETLRKKFSESAPHLKLFRRQRRL